MARIIVVGSLHHDIIVTAPRQPEPGETLMGETWRTALGGKGANQAVAAKRWGAETHMVGAVGQDDMGASLLTALNAAGVGCEMVAQHDDVGSGMSIATIDGTGDYTAVVVSGANKAIDPATVASCGVQAGDVIILQNEVPEAVNLAAAEAARRSGASVVWNVAPFREDRCGLQGLVDVLVVNAVEARQMCGIPVADLKGAEEAARALSSTARASVVTAGADGLAAQDRDGVCFSIPAIVVENPVAHGAGDVLVGTLAAGLAAGHSLHSALTAANTAAAQHVGGANA
ncbi:MAG: PfkB family carbohydrate kinase [Pseudomonadota bacterium]